MIRKSDEMAFLSKFINFILGNKSQTEKQSNIQKSEIDGYIERANDLQLLMNKLLHSANESSNVSDREANLAIVRAKLQELKNISSDCPAIKIINLDGFEMSIEGVAAETSDMKKGLQTQSNTRNTSTFSDNDNAILESLSSYFRVINESIDIARKSKSLDTTKSRLQVARNTLHKAREVASQFSLNNVDGFDEAEAEIDRIVNAIENDTPKTVDGMREIEPDPYFSNPSRNLLKEATALKKEKRYLDACNKLREAYLADGAENLMIEDRLRLPMYLQLAGRNDEGWAELNRLLKKYNDQFSNSIILNQIKIFLKKEGNPNATNQVRVIESVELSKISTSDDNLQETWRDNEDIVDGFIFKATMQLRTPLRVLKRHGEIHSDINTKRPEIAREMWEGMWALKQKTWRELGFDIDDFDENMSSSDIGYVKPSEYLPFLLSVREVVESNESVNSRINMLRDSSITERWKDYVDRYGGIDKITNRFFPRFVDSIPTLNKTTIDELSRLGIVTPNKLEATNDSTLMDINGIGKAKLKTIRDYCASITKNRDNERMENVIR